MIHKNYVWIALLLLALTTSCARKKMVLVEEKRVGKTHSPARTGNDQAARKDNGKHKGWYKNPNNPHHPNSTKHSGQRGNGNGNTTIIINNTNQNANVQTGKPGKGGPGNGGHHPGKGGSHGGGNGKGNGNGGKPGNGNGKGNGKK
jgi:hypothetical protein